MGRMKSYDRDSVADRAMRLFWERGYHATSTRELARAMDVNPYSLYAEFGSKEALYEAAINRYEETVVPRHFGRLEASDASLADVRHVIVFFGENGDREGSHLGCLLCNASTELAPTVEGSRASTARFVDRVTAAFRNALGNAEANGELTDHAPIHELSSLLTTLLMGLFVLSRAQVDSAVLRGAAAQALSRLDEVTRRGQGT